ncbi:MAG: T9SS type A sorting domain-containing protein [Candidatus Eisenbacteria bacterium]|uniref:T9SS type A sorting domain-containing protein n=1 Tax=Eiseniibacteriota bacterium TaxID=2212470 RepID=A0A849SSU7_UNCEI|nr:T9SS type A sorting domain-containing protein [Candidatus Eisenbacteria bacterium]
MNAPTARIALLLVVLLTGRAEAQSGGAYSLGWSSLDGGGQTLATGGLYRIAGSLGQAEAGKLTGGLYSLSGGFWTPPSAGAVDAPVTEAIPRVFATRPAAPNPFRTTTTLAFELPATRHVDVAVHGIDGRLVRRLIDHELTAGRHRAVWDGRDERGQLVASGVYFARIRAGESTSTLRVVRLD